MRPILCNLIRKYRRDRGLSQAELGAAIGVSKNCISSFERGEYCPTARHAALLCWFFDCSFEDLFFLV